MKELVTLMESIGCNEIKTYIQSGNVVFRSPVEHPENLAKTISETVNKRFGFAPKILLLSQQDLEAAVVKNPFPEACDEGNTLHLYFLAENAVRPDLKRLGAVQSDSEHFALIDQIFYLHAPDGIGRSRLATSVEKNLGVAVTARNWNTVCKLLEMLKQEG